ncbi:MAG: coenzyme F420-0:L-glutamate ligase [Chloroflexi bacterium]|nr:coenzyme F420-0:L-glutamate ligase [Chloroflexota bacterium]
MTLTLTPLPGIPLILPGDDLGSILMAATQTAHINLDDGDVLVLAQKIISKAEGRLVKLTGIKPTARAREVAAQAQKDARLVELILRESREVLRVTPGTIIVEHRLGFICANAGIDHSNVQDPEGNDETVLLLPEDPDRSALEIRRLFKTICGCRLGVLVIDSHGRAWRQGVSGVSIGISGLPGIVDRRGWPDLYGRRLKITTIAAADELAAAASLVMGEAAEKTPVVHVRGFPYPLREGRLSELIRPKEKDLFR